MITRTTVAESKSDIHVGKPANAAIPQKGLAKESDLTAKSMYFSKSELIKVYEPTAKPAPSKRRLTTDAKMY